MQNAEKTAIKRKSLPKPVRSSMSYVTGRILDYGCGHGIVETKLDNVVSYDPYYRPDKPEGEFDTVLCIYVLNVISFGERCVVLSEVYNRMRKGGIVVVAIRTDRAVDFLARKNDWREEYDGYISHMGTFQKGFAIDELISFVGSQGFEFLEQTDCNTFVFRRL